MNGRKLREMKRYILIKNSAGGCMLFGAGIIGVAAAVGAIACYISCIIESDTTNLFPAILLTILSLIFILLLALPHILAKKEQNKWIRDNKLEEMVADFEKAEAPLGSSDAVRLGNTWIFGRGCGKPVEYSSIRSLKIQTLKNNGVPLETTLFAKLVSGKSVAVCREIRKSEAGEAIAATINAIRSKVPNVKT